MGETKGMGPNYPVQSWGSHYNGLVRTFHCGYFKVTHLCSCPDYPTHHSVSNFIDPLVPQVNLGWEFCWFAFGTLGEYIFLCLPQGRNFSNTYQFIINSEKINAIPVHSQMLPIRRELTLNSLVLITIFQQNKS